MLVFGQPDIREPEIEEVVATLRSKWIGTGPRTQRFEADFARYVGAPGAVAVNSCTSALMLAMQASDLGPGDEVITTALTFCATVNAIVHTGAKPVLADIDPVTMNIDPDDVAAKTNGRTRAVIPVHFAGRPCAMDRLTRHVADHDLLLIEDCAHAIETTWRGQHAGTFGDFGCYSFYATKNLTTGEGGMCIGPVRDVLDRVKVLALHGMSRDAWKRFGDEGYKHYFVVDAGYKCNMTDLQAALGLHQLQRIEQGLERRNAIWSRYDAEFANLPLTLPAPQEANTRHARHLYTVLLDEKDAGISRDAFLAAMTQENIGVGVHYLSISEHPFYQDTFGWKAEECPNALDVGRRTVSLPLSAGMTDSDVEDVVAAVHRVLRSGRS